MDDGDQIVGHKTFSTGELCAETGMPMLRHEPLTRREADAIEAECARRDAARAAAMPDVQSAINALFEAWLRLKELGWREAIYCPKDGTSFEVIEAGSTGIFPCHYDGKWPGGTWWIEEDGGCPSHPILFRLYPADEAKRQEKMAALKAKFDAERAGDIKTSEGES